LHGMPTALSTPYLVSLYCWVALEVGLAVRDVVRRRARLGTDRGTRAIVGLSLGGSVFVAIMMRQWLPTLDVPAPDAFAVVGLIAIWTGLAVRVWAVISLGGSFSTFVHADADQTVVTGGPYRWVRHPSYTGLLLIALGIGLGARNWLSILICAVVPVLGLLPRIRVEESELTRVLGEPYQSYRRTTRRLVPGLW
jgi:protein-S-isoprenylcysteine O-methyltransferase Ste14